MIDLPNKENLLETLGQDLAQAGQVVSMPNQLPFLSGFQPSVLGKENGPNVLKKLAAVMAENEYIQKTGKHPTGFKFLKESDLKRKVGKSFSDHGLVLVPCSATVSSYETIRGKDPSNPRHETLTTVNLGFRIFDKETGEYVQGQMPGQGVDGGDKGVYKAITGAIKYILTSVLLIETGDDPENEAPEAPPPPKTTAKALPPTVQQATTATQPPAPVTTPQAMGLVPASSLAEPVSKADKLPNPPEDDLRKDQAGLPTAEQYLGFGERAKAFAKTAGVTAAQLKKYFQNAVSQPPYGVKDASDLKYVPWKILDGAATILFVPASIETVKAFVSQPKEAV